MGKPDRFDVIANLLVLTVLAVTVATMLMQPGRPLRLKWESWRDRGAVADRVRDNWSALVDAPTRLDSGTGLVHLVEFADYQCPYCASMNVVVHQAIGEHDELGVVFRHLPLSSIHPQAETAALAAICAEFQGRFKKMHDELYRVSLDASTVWRDIAEVAGVPELARFDDCLRGQEAKDRLRQDVRLARDMGVTATPTFYGPSSMLRGVTTSNSLFRLAQKRN